MVTVRGGDVMKHIVVIVDGTWVSAADGQNPFSNAYNLNWMLDNQALDGNPQIVFYSSGIGSDKDAQPYFSGATARGIDNQVREAYINICSNYRHTDQHGKPDRLYIFGFSRGAVVCRALAAMISKFGILRPAQMDLFPVLWNRFTKPEIFGSRPLAPRIAQRDVAVEFVGLFDCVFGYRGNKGSYYSLRFPDFRVPDKVRYAVQLLSLDDERHAFAPMFWESTSGGDTVLEQIWLPGVHSDVGGTYPSNVMGRLALFSMIDLVQQRTQLAFHARSVERMEKSVSDDIEINSDLTGIWKVLSLRPYKRNCPIGDTTHSIHPIVFELEIKRYKGKQVPSYKAAAIGHDHLPAYDGFKRKDWLELIHPD